jgi:hypothetical protein
LAEANLSWARLAEADLSGAQLERADLSGAQLNGADLSGAFLERADLSESYLERVDLSWAHLERAYLIAVQLAGAFLQNAKLEAVVLKDAQLIDAQGIGPFLVDVSWAGTNVSVIPWSEMVMLGDEAHARQRKDKDGKKKHPVRRFEEYTNAMRATHQLAVVLQDQGLTTEASRFAYRAKCLERAVRWYELRTIAWHEHNSEKRTVNSIRKGLARFISVILSWFFSWFLFLIAGYGYRLRFCLLWYLLTIGGFTLAYLLMEPHYFTWWSALGESVNVFHGRGASPNLPQLMHPARFALLTVIEAWTGLVIEVVLVATLIQRFFGK